MAQATEIANLRLDAIANLEDPQSSSGAIWQSTMDTVSQQDGYQRLYWGRQVEDPHILTMLVDWDSVEAHKNFQKSPVHAPFETHLGKILEGPATLHYANLSPHPPAPATSSNFSPVTECLTLYHPTNPSVSAFEEKWHNFRSTLEKYAEGYRSSSAGWITEELEYQGEKAAGFAIFIGWDSVDAHMKYRETQHFKETIIPLREGLKGIEAYHATLLEK